MILLRRLANLQAIRPLRSHFIPLRLPSTSSTRHLRSYTTHRRTPEEGGESWLTRRVRESPGALKLFLGLARVFGYGSPKQLAGRRAFGMYEEVCAVRADEERTFWTRDCYLPPTFQSWFTITNLHVWLLTVRLRALPAPHGEAYIQGLIDHFFLDVEDRIRAVLQPPPTPTTPYTFHSPFYTNPNAPSPPSSPTAPKDEESTRKTRNTRSRAPDRLVTRQMKIFKEQWAGMGLAFDLGLVKGDAEMAGAVWRNLLGARGARGISFEDASPSPTSEVSANAKFRRSVNVVGGAVESVAKIDERGLEREESRDDGSGVSDFAPAESERYVRYPELMVQLVAYMRRELARLDTIEDRVILEGGSLSVLKFGKVSDEMRKGS